MSENKTGASFLSLLAAALGFLLLYSAYRSSEMGGDFFHNLFVMWPLWIAVLILAGLGGVLTYIKNRNIQDARNDKATVIAGEASPDNNISAIPRKRNSANVDLVHSQPSQKYILYLRPFKYKSRFQVMNPEKYSGFTFNPVKLAAFNAQEDYIILDEFLANAMSGYTSIAVGEEIDSKLDAGVGKAKLNDLSRWKETVEPLIKKSSLIFIVPSDSESVLWEIQCILRNDMQKKTLLVIPPITDRILARWWRRTANAVDKISGLELPSENDAEFGAIYNILSKNTVKTYDNLFQSSYKNFRKFVDQEAKKRSLYPTVKDYSGY